MADQGFTSLSRKLLNQVLSIYFILTLVVTAGQILAEYANTKNHVKQELITVQRTFSAGLTRAIWELNLQQAQAIAEGVMALPMVEGVTVRDETGKVMIQMGTHQNEEADTATARIEPELRELSGGYFGYSFPLAFEFSGRAMNLGDVTILSSRSVVLERIKIGIYFLIGNAIIKTTVLILLFVWAFNRLLTRPLTELTQQMVVLDVDEFADTRIKLSSNNNNELTIVETAFNQMLDKLGHYKQGLESAQRDLLGANRQLDEQNLQLEQEVARKTSSLSRSLMELDRQKMELERHQRELRAENEMRRRTEEELTLKRNELERSLRDLRDTQAQLVESEKMASLGTLVAGVAHEINTPVGVGVTAVTYLQERINELRKQFDDKKLTQSGLNSFLEDAEQSAQLLSTNLHRAGELIASFKQVAVDQTSEAVRDLDLRVYVDEIISSLQPKVKKTPHKVLNNVIPGLVMHCRAGALAQVLTNLIMNSLIHAFAEGQSGEMVISAHLDGNTVFMAYSDNGRGVSPEHLRRLFEPFFTTRRGQGGSGLGTHIVYNLVTQSLGGTISAESTEGKGLAYHITLPRSCD
ncbi:MAG: sensor histidine kinase [Gammaproteobacteria bacterium]|nr:sensor histidine kinase [Gammaproteobacteria bacterium]